PWAIGELARSFSAGSPLADSIPAHDALDRTVPGSAVIEALIGGALVSFVNQPKASASATGVVGGGPRKELVTTGMKNGLAALSRVLQARATQISSHAAQLAKAMQ